ncbi:chitooligosaccharide synthase NodC [Bradyrhizobium sacchari]|uniref:N-acetylglucosaminyltransferase n=4 Tax=Bradyrhizobium TaxID=374 RepID=A0A560HUH2_9BRAD|nr:chitooligosaccharide synthase NodC [Bradyrhizobium sacchari]TWB48784.1 beta-1,4-N-acetylglucosaminyltransferase NodC [Bradyrhizobium sacchari]TWB67945.1 beta-1,4-N-acetylglucosaminyltransferase NodC [Bradyrhizobium sacchari]
MDLLATTSAAAVSTYALLSTIYKSAQALYAQPATNSSQPDNLGQSECILPSVDVIVPCFNEDPNTLADCLASLASQDYTGQLQVFVVDDGSANRDVVAPIHKIYENDTRFSIILLAKNVGKRKAQIAAIRSSSGDLVLNVDSDTILAPDVVTKLVFKMHDPEVGAAMGQLIASNRSQTWLTRLIDMEYWLACNEERAAQARFGAVMCCCGPCAMYRRSALDLLLDQYETQFFRGKPSDFGEDRHLTILMLKAGFRTEYVPDAIAATVVPHSLGPYLRQQLRWARSTFRDTFLALRLLPELDGYLTLDVIGQNLGPLLLALSSLAALAQLLIGGSIPWWTGLTIAAMTMVRCSVAALRARELRFLGFSLHTPINIFLLLPLKAYALFTLSNSDWLSRKVANVPEEEKQCVILRPNAGRSAATTGGTGRICKAGSSHPPLSMAASESVSGRDRSTACK